MAEDATRSASRPHGVDIDPTTLGSVDRRQPRRTGAGGRVDYRVTLIALWALEILTRAIDLVELPD